MPPESPWDHPDWYDLHDNASVAGVEREPEHYRELVLALPPLDREHRVIDAGAGTGKLAALVAAAYPRLGALTLMEPNAAKLERARERLGVALSPDRVRTLAARLGTGDALPRDEADLVLVGSVLMPIMEWRGGTLAEGRAWLVTSLTDILGMLRPGGWMYAVETVAMHWVEGPDEGRVRRLRTPELVDTVAGAGFEGVEVTYRFRDRVGLRARKH